MQLYINSYGCYLHVRDAMFEVRVPSQESGGYEKHQFAVSKVTSIVITTSGSLSTDAIQLALQNNIDIVFTDMTGFPLGRVWHSKLGSTTKIRKRQLEASLNQIGLNWTIKWLTHKVDNQLEFIKSLKKHRSKMIDFLDTKIEKIQALKESMQLQESAKSVDEVAETLRGLEGTAGRLYFETLSSTVPEAYRFQGRSFRPANDVFNAFLNYAYGVLYSKVEKALIIAGLDPYVGFMHRDDYNQKSMVFDFIEPYRIYADTVVFRLFSSKQVNQSHSEFLTNGITLNKSGKELLLERLTDYLDVQAVRYNGKNMSRARGLQMDAHRFANELIGR